jgi:streptogramin lyase
MGVCKPFIWSDNWAVENDVAWMVSGNKDILFEIDMAQHQVVRVIHVPDADGWLFRKNSHCIKFGKDIVLLPDCGDKIWIYDSLENEFYDIPIEKPDGLRLSITCFWKINDKLFAVSSGLKQIMIIDVSKRLIDEIYDFPGGQNEKISESINVNQYIYTISSVTNRIYRFDTVEKSFKEYIIPNLSDKMFSICYDGEQFWLGGYRKAVYVWDERDNTIRTIDKFPENFGVYNFDKKYEELVNIDSNEFDVPAFVRLVPMESGVWMIPWQANKMLYVDKATYEVKAFELDEEEENKESISDKELYTKYLVQYVLNGRYIGLYSLKNKCILEIDTEQMKSKYVEYTFSGQAVEDLWAISKKRQILFSENDYFDREVFGYFLMSR